MKVLIGIPCLLQGGTEMQTLVLARVLREAGHEVVVCCYFEHHPGVVARFERAGARVDFLELERSVSLVRLLWVLSRRFVGVELVHVQYMAPGFVGVLAARLAGSASMRLTHRPTSAMTTSCLAKAERKARMRSLSSR
ncbi:MAG: glycosyltransferase family 4 protein, partial [Verrucomicrobiae bacterium]|nr:glycosyltransferase family 4 protein [Verrucomicrobiae bacterium]